jgi:hypothetical protein
LQLQATGPYIFSVEGVVFFRHELGLTKICLAFPLLHAFPGEQFFRKHYHLDIISPGIYFNIIVEVFDQIGEIISGRSAFFVPISFKSIGIEVFIIALFGYSGH